MSVPFPLKNSKGHLAFEGEAIPALVVHICIQRMSSEFSLLLLPGHEVKFMQTTESSCEFLVFSDLVSDIHSYLLLPPYSFFTGIS